jgi:hypothetical protein
MRNPRIRIFSALCVGALLSCVALNSQAEGEGDAATDADKTGTNPINFSPELRVYNEYQKLNTAGDGMQNVTTLEGRLPLLGGKLQLRSRARYSVIKVDLNDDGVDELDESGFGDVDFRLLNVPYMNMAKRRAAAVGLEVFLDTASEAALGSGSTSLGPQFFLVKFFSWGLFGPGVQYKFSIDEDEGRSETDQVLIDLNVLVMAKDKLSWFFADPQIVIDNESSIEYSIVDLEFGAMMSKWADLPGHSVYVRPSFGLGADRPVDGSIEVGYKIVL